MKKVLIIGSNNNAALAIAQDLGSNHDIICFGFKEDFNKVEYSKYVHSWVNVSKKTPLAQIKISIVELALEKEVEVIIPTNDRFTLLLSDNTLRQKLKNTTITTPNYDVLIKGLDKLTLTRLAGSVGLNTPKTYDAKATDFQDFPVYLKSRISWDIVDNQFERGILKKINSHQQLMKELKTLDESKVYIQNAVHGEGWGLEIIAKDGVLLNYFGHIRLRESNPKGGYSSAAMSIKPLDFYISKIKLILKELHWTGVAMFEFKGDYKTEESNLIEMNCRFWGSLPVALHSGNRFPHLLLKTLDGEEITQPNYKANVKVRWVQADIIHFFKVLRLKNRKQYDVPSVAETFKNVFLTKMKSYNKINGDWKPGLYEMTLGMLKKI